MNFVAKSGEKVAREDNHGVTEPWVTTGSGLVGRDPCGWWVGLQLWPTAAGVWVFGRDSHCPAPAQKPGKG